MFAGSEITEIAIQIEINGRDFYNVLLGKARNGNAKDIFSYLAGEEEKHIGTFREILKSFHKYEPKEAYPDEYFSYMRSLASDCIFTQKDKGRAIAEKVTSEKEAAELGIEFERDSVSFYRGMKKITSPEDTKFVDMIIEQEKDHVRQLIELRKTL